MYFHNKYLWVLRSNTFCSIARIAHNSTNFKNSLYIYNQIFDAGAGAPPTSVGPLPGNWLAAGIADLTLDLQVLLSWGSTVASFHSLQYSLSVSSMSAWVSLTPVYITCCYNSTNFGLCSKISNKLLLLKCFDLQWRSWSELQCVPSCLNPNFRNIKHSSMQILWRQKL